MCQLHSVKPVFYAGCYGVWNIVKLENILILHLQSFDNISHFLFNSSPDEQMTHLVKKKIQNIACRVHIVSHPIHINMGCNYNMYYYIISRERAAERRFFS